MRLRSVAVLVSLLLLATIDAQVRERIEVRLIEVDAVVTDRDGNSVTGLTAQDFELFENGRRQEITNFSEYRERGVQASGLPSPPPEGRPEAYTTRAVAAPPPRTIVLFIDSLPLHGPARTTFFDRLRSLLDRTMREGDRAQVLIWNDKHGLRPLSTLTTDRAVINQAVATAEGTNDVEARGPTPEEYARFFAEMAAADPARRGDPVAATIAGPQSTAGELELAMMRRKTAAMQRVVNALVQPEGRSVFVYVSEAFPMVAGKRLTTGRRSAGDMSTPAEAALRTMYTTRGLLERVIASANASGISFYALRPERPKTAPFDMQSLESDEAVLNRTVSGSEAIAEELVMQNEAEALTLVAEETGGTFGVGPEGVQQVVDRIVRDVESYYTLAYRAQSDGSDRKRRIEVRTKNRDYTVRSRKAIVEKSDRTRSREAVLARLFATGPTGALKFSVKTGKPAPAGKNQTIPIELSIPAEQLEFGPEGKEIAAKFTVIAVSGVDPSTSGEMYEQSQRVVAHPGKPRQGPIRYNFSVLHDRKPKALAIGVFDEKSGLAGTTLVRLGTQNATVETAAATAATPDPVADPAWLARATNEKKMIVAFYRPARCHACTAFERESLPHPAIARRLEGLIFVTAPGGEQPGMAVFDRAGNLRARWNGVPRDTTTFGTILDSVLAAAPNFEHAIELSDLGPYEGELETAVGLAKLGRRDEARAAIERARAHGSDKARDLAVVGAAMLDISEGKTTEALQALQQLTTTASTPDTKASAFVGIGMIHRMNNAIDKAIEAFTTAVDIAGPESDLGTNAAKAIEQLRATAGSVRSPIRIVSFGEQIVTGRKTVRTSIESTAITKVIFSVDGAERAAVTKPPFSTTIDFGRVPQAHTIRAVAHDATGKELGRAELAVNAAGETFWLRLLEPRPGAASGNVRVTATLRNPPARQVKRVVVSWNDAERAVMLGAPWETEVDVPNETGILRAVAELDDGRTAEDAVLLNASGYAETSTVPLVELPVTIAGGSVTTDQIVIREAGKRLPVESVTQGAEAPLTVGLLIDSSGSMQKHLPDVQEAAIRFLDTAVSDNGRAFLVTFDSTARLVQTPTQNRDALRQRILNIRPSGSTALYDAMILGLLQFEGVKGRRALVVFSDGADVSSSYRREDVADLAKRSNIPIYLIVARTPAPPRPMISNIQPRTGLPAPGRGGGPVTNTTLWDASITDLGRVSNQTGGRWHTIRKLEELSEVYAKIENDLKAQALVVVRTEPGKSENDWRTIDVDVTGRRDVRAPAGYYAPW